MKQRDAVRRIAGAAAGLGAGAVFTGNIEPARRLYGTPESLRFRRPAEEDLLRLALARDEVPAGVLEERSALAQLAASVVEQPEQARAFARDPAAAFRSLGYEAASVRLDEPEIRACLLLADEEVQRTVRAGDPAAFIQALCDRCIDPDSDDTRLAAAARQALVQEAALGRLAR